MTGKSPSTPATSPAAAQLLHTPRARPQERGCAHGNNTAAPHTPSPARPSPGPSPAAGKSAATPGPGPAAAVPRLASRSSREPATPRGPLRPSPPGEGYACRPSRPRHGCSGQGHRRSPCPAAVPPGLRLPLHASRGPPRSARGRPLTSVAAGGGVAGGEDQDSAQRQRLGAPHAEVVVDLPLAQGVGQGRHLGSSMTTACDGAGGRSGAALGPRWRRTQTPPLAAVTVPSAAAERSPTPRRRGGAAALLPAPPLPLGRQRAAPALASPPRGGRLGGALRRAGESVYPPGLVRGPLLRGRRLSGGRAGPRCVAARRGVVVTELRGGAPGRGVYLSRDVTAGAGQHWLFSK